jgi:hypothetical protein
MDSAVAGTEMVWSLPDANFTKVRTFLNAGIVLGDVGANSIVREHLRKPVIQGFPVHGYRSTFQTLHELQYGQATPYNHERWGPIPDRLMLKPDLCDTAENRKWRTPIGKTIYAPNGHIRAYLTANMLARTDPAAHEYVSSTNAASGQRVQGGWFEIYHYNRTTRSESTNLESRRHVYGDGSDTGIQPAVDNLNMMADIATTPGRYDVYLVYVRDTFDEDLFLQIDLTTIQFTVEAL